MARKKPGLRAYMERDKNRAITVIREAALALNELDALIVSYEVLRAKKDERIEKYKDAVSKDKYKKAQVAAIEADRCTDAINEITATRNKMLTAFEGMWTKYTNDPETSHILVCYLRNKENGDKTLAQTECSQEKLFQVVAYWRAFMRQSQRRIIAREYLYLKRNNFMKTDQLKKEQWWVPLVLEFIEDKESKMAEHDSLMEGEENAEKNC